MMRVNIWSTFSSLCNEKCFSAWNKANALKSYFLPTILNLCVFGIPFVNDATRTTWRSSRTAIPLAKRSSFLSRLWDFKLSSNYPFSCNIVAATAAFITVLIIDGSHNFSLLTLAQFALAALRTILLHEIFKINQAEGASSEEYWMELIIQLVFIRSISFLFTAKNKTTKTKNLVEL